MKILQVINNLATGGAEKLLLESLPFYVERGINMDVLVLNGSSYPFLESLRNLNCCNVYSLGLHSVYNPIHIFKIIPYFKKYDIVHVHLFPGQYWVVLSKLISLAKVKLVFTEHCTTNRRLENRLFKILDRQIYRGYQEIVCITPEIKDILKEHTNLSDSVFSLIENGVNLKGIRESKQTVKNEINEKIDQSDILLIQVAGFRPQKDHFTLIEALNFLPKNIKLILVGDGVLRKACEDLTIKLHLSDRIIFLGLRMDVPQLLKTADIIVLSSKYEGLSLSCIEGMASGRPFIASDVPGLSEVVKDAGILFEQGNSEELAEKILELLRDKDYYDRVVESCQIRAAQYDIQTMIDKHIALYESLC
jgi:glycosyltransferase involved in cell wall biosynthesis